MKNTYLRKITDIIQSISHSNIAQWLSRNKKTVVVTIILMLSAFLGYYIYSHPDVLQNITHIGFANVLLLIVLYGGLLLVSVGLTYITIRVCNKRLPLINSLFLTIYSTVINFFGPLQSGPVVRSIYLKRKIKLRIRDYTYAMLFYYFIYAALNTSLLFINKIPWLSVLGVIAAIVLVSIGTNKLGFGAFKKYIFYIFILTAAQILVITFIYSVELNAINPLAHYSFLQAISYTASANLSLFVSLTPGAIGFRETFLIISQSLHDISTSSIIAAGIVDRAVYVAFLALLFLISGMLHLKNIIATDKD